MSPRAEFSKRTKNIAWNRSGGRCEICTAKLFTGNVEYHHGKEATFDGGKDIENCIVVCRNCHRSITRSRAPVIAKSNRQRNAHIGIKSSRSRWAYGKDSAWKKKIDGSVVRR